MYYSLMKENRSETGRKSIGVLALVGTSERTLSACTYMSLLLAIVVRILNHKKGPTPAAFCSTFRSGRCLKEGILKVGKSAFKTPIHTKTETEQFGLTSLDKS